MRYVIDEATHTVRILDIDHRRDPYRAVAAEEASVFVMNDERIHNGAGIVRVDVP